MIHRGEARNSIVSLISCLESKGILLRFRVNGERRFDSRKPGWPHVMIWIILRFHLSIKSYGTRFKSYRGGTASFSTTLPPEGGRGALSTAVFAP
jgi:hypothetical protein